MKSLIVKTTASLILTLLVFSSCEKRVFDYRNKYCGEWEFTIDSMTTLQTSETIENFTGEITYDKKGEDNLINIKFRNGRDFNAEINKSGDLTMCGGSGSFSDKKNLNFEYLLLTCDTTELSLGFPQEHLQYIGTPHKVTATKK